MYSDRGSRCSHRLGFPIRTSPDHSLLATPRSLSQLTTSFIAYLRQGIHTHALSSLTIKSILNTDVLSSALVAFTCSKCPSIFNCQRTTLLLYCKLMVGLGRIELPTSPLSGVRSSQLSYRPGWASEQNRAHKQAGFPKSWWSWSGSNRRPPECKSGALPAELQPLVRINQSRPIGRLDPETSSQTLIYFRNPEQRIPSELWSGTTIAVYLSATPPTFS